MGPVSFNPIKCTSRENASALARRLTEIGIRVDVVDADATVLVRNPDYARALEQAHLLSSASVDSDAGAADTETVLNAIEIEPLSQRPDVSMTLPGSKSHTNRALLCAGLAQGTSVLTNVLRADDTDAMVDSLKRLGVQIESESNGESLSVTGLSLDPESVASTIGDPAVPEDKLIEVDVRQSGTTGRFLLAAISGLSGEFRLDGDAQLRARPFGPQIGALKQMGAEIEGEQLPLRVSGRTLRGGEIEVSASLSSQFLSGLLLAAPMCSSPTSLVISDGLISRPYVELTVHTMAAFGVPVEVNANYSRFDISPAFYKPNAVQIEPDASAASYFFAAAAMTGGRVRIEGLGAKTVQGDVKFVQVLEQMGAEVVIGDSFIEVRGTGTLRGVDVDMAHISDTVQTLAVTAVAADSPTTIRGVGFIRHKETDRVSAPVSELQRLGIEAQATEDGMVIQPGIPKPARVQTYDDHRMAMSFALLGLCHKGITIVDPGCVTKTFPSYFSALDQLRG